MFGALLARLLVNGYLIRGVLHPPPDESVLFLPRGCVSSGREGSGHEPVKFALFRRVIVSRRRSKRKLLRAFTDLPGGGCPCQAGGQGTREFALSRGSYT